jgi:hypothetical protein
VLLGSLVSRLDRWAGRFNRWFGGAAIAANAERGGPAGGQQTVDPTAVVAALGEIERDDLAVEGDEDGSPRRTAGNQTSALSTELRGLVVERRFM